MPVARSPLLDRRSFLKMAGASWLASLAPEAAFALERSDAVYASGFRARDGSYAVATLTERGEILDRVPLPARAHGMTFCKMTGRTVAFARRPGTYAMIFDPHGHSEPIVITSGEDRHFFGHGCFSADGRLLYASENDFNANRGMIGIYDATDGFARMGEFPSGGIGTHDLTLGGDGRTLVAANGGIETHPDFGRTKLNIDRMEPSLALIDTATGALIEKHALPENLRQLSTRHVDVDADGNIWFACQYEGPRNDRPPLIGHIRRGEALSFVALPDSTLTNLANYVGAIAVNRQEGLVGATSPNGGTFVIFEARTGKLVREERLADASGVAAGGSGIIASSYDGTFGPAKSDVAWDQHIVNIGMG